MTHTRKLEAIELKKIATEMRLVILDLVKSAKGGHIGGSYSVIEILTVLYHRVMRYRIDEPNWELRDRLILSKGHCCMALYSMLYSIGMISEETIYSYYQNGSKLGGHPKLGDVNGIEATTGSLGHGLALGLGMGLAHQLDDNPTHIYIVLGDGEMNEGSVWESLMAAPQQKLLNVTIIIDSNKLESLDSVENILSIEPLGERLESFGWRVSEVDGQDCQQLIDAFESKTQYDTAPHAIIAHTQKGAGVSFMEGVSMWHHRPVKLEEYEQAKSELQKTILDLKS